MKFLVVRTDICIAQHKYVLLYYIAMLMTITQENKKAPLSPIKLVHQLSYWTGEKYYLSISNAGRKHIYYPLTPHVGEGGHWGVAGLICAP